MLILVKLTLMITLIHGHGHHHSGKTYHLALSELASGAHLVMETHSGNVLARPAREAMQEGIAAVPAKAPDGDLSGGNKRAKNSNKKSNKSHNKMLHVGGHKPVTQKSFVSAGEEQLQQGQHSNVKQQRQMLKPQHHEHQHHAAPTCRYAKSSWTECDAKTNMRTRTLNLKKGDSHCLPTRTVQKKCKKTCRYEKGSWSACNAGQMTREDKLKASEDGSQSISCNLVRIINKKCNPGTVQKLIPGDVRDTKVRKHKEKGNILI
ncbi:GH15739 [Drosophila grimshawi]|uniref:GH15739 n=1 Tax=Drosophila grimshawi TaxID=7222 RepID=B4IYK1_DROGR|nr:GH15739 [Drosophila grimshawi]